MIVRKWLQCFLGLGLAVAIFAPVQSPAAEVNFKSDTILRGFERDTQTQTNAGVAPAYEYLQVDAGNLDKPGLALHLYGWGRWDLANNHYYEDDTAGELLYGYLEYSHKLAHFNAKLGRQSVFEGVANEVIDGLRLSSDLGRYFSGSVYAGQPVALDDVQGRSGDSIYGGRLAHHLPGWYDIGISAKQIRNDSEDAEKLAGVDLSVFLPHGVNLFGYSAYNLDTEGWGEHSYELRFAAGPVQLRPYFQHFKYEDYFNTKANSANPFRFLAGTGEELTIAGADVTLPVGDAWVLVAKGKHYSYDVLDDTSQYYSLQATWSGKGQSQIGGEFGYMKGDAAQNDYYLTRGFVYWDQMAAGCPIGFVSGDVVYVSYDKAIYDQDSSLFISLALGKKFLDDSLDVKLSGDYSDDPYFDRDLRGMLSASYHFGRTL